MHDQARRSSLPRREAKPSAASGSHRMCPPRTLCPLKLRLIGAAGLPEINPEWKPARASWEALCRAHEGGSPCAHWHSNACIPVVALILPIAALSAADLREAVHSLDGVNILGLLVAERPLDAHANGRAVGYREGSAIQSVGQQGLRVARIDKVAALIV